MENEMKPEQNSRLHPADFFFKSLAPFAWRLEKGWGKLLGAPVTISHTPQESDRVLLKPDQIELTPGFWTLLSPPSGIPRVLMALHAAPAPFIVSLISGSPLPCDDSIDQSSPLFQAFLAPAFIEATRLLSGTLSCPLKTSLDHESLFVVDATERTPAALLGDTPCHYISYSIRFGTDNPYDGWLDLVLPEDLAPTTALASIPPQIPMYQIDTFASALARDLTLWLSEAQARTRLFEIISRQNSKSIVTCLLGCLPSAARSAFLNEILFGNRSILSDVERHPTTTVARLLRRLCHSRPPRAEALPFLHGALKRMMAHERLDENLPDFGHKGVVDYLRTLPHSERDSIIDDWGPDTDREAHDDREYIKSNIHKRQE